MALIGRFERGDEFFEVSRDGADVALRSGRGDDASVARESFRRYRDAFDFMSNAIGERVLAGYVLVGDDIFNAAPPNDAMEDAIVASFDDAFAWEVYADWLSAHGDLRGELIALERDPSPTARSRIESLVLRNEHLWLGAFYQSAHHGRRTRSGARARLKLEYRSGFVERAWISHGGMKLDEELPKLLQCSAMQFVRTLDVTDWNDRTATKSVIEVLAAHAPRSLRRLGLPIPPHNKNPPIDALLPALPFLEELKAHGALSRMVHEHLQTLELRGPFREPVEVDAPNLTRLAIVLQRPLQVSATLVDALRLGAPKLERLAIDRATNADALFEAVVCSPLASRLVTLQMNGGRATGVSDNAARVAIDRAADLTNIKFNLRRSEVSPSMVQRMRAAGLNVLV